MSLTVLYDENCPFCRRVRRWLEGQAQLVALEFVPAGSATAREWFPDLDPARTLKEVTVVAEDGAVYEGPAAYVLVLWALVEYRERALLLAQPGMAPLARGIVAAAGQLRQLTKGDKYGEECDDDKCGR